MADRVNAQVTDAITQTGTTVVGEAPAMAMGTLYQSMAHASGLALSNSTSNQHNLNQLNPSIVSQAIAMINSVKTP